MTSFINTSPTSCVSKLRPPTDYRRRLQLVREHVYEAHDALITSALHRNRLASDARRIQLSLVGANSKLRPPTDFRAILERFRLTSRATSDQVSA